MRLFHRLLINYKSKNNKIYNFYKHRLSQYLSIPYLKPVARNVLEKQNGEKTHSKKARKTDIGARRLFF